MALPGEGRAREALASKLNNVGPTEAANLAASRSISNPQKVNASNLALTSSQFNGRMVEEIDKEFDTIMRRMDYANLSKDEKQNAYNMLIGLKAIGNPDMERHILRKIMETGIGEFFKSSQKDRTEKDGVPQYWYKFFEELLPTINDSENGALTIDQRYSIIRNAENYIGRYTYGRGKGQVDCSSFVYELYQKVGINLKYPEDHDVTANIAKYVFTEGWGIDKEDLKPGDLIFWDNNLKDEGRWADIHHVGIYLCTDENGQMWILDSTPSEGGPAIQPLWSENRRDSYGFLVYGYASVPNANSIL